MNRILYRISIGFFSLCLCAVTVFARELIPVGEVIGLELSAGTVTVAAFDDAFPAVRSSGLQIGDEILSVDGTRIQCAEDIRKALNHSDGTVELLISRSGAHRHLRLEPEITETGPKLGIYLRQGITGIGTVTFYDPESGAFGTLGHGVNDSHGKLLPMTKGNAYRASVVSIQKGKPGTPGQLKGALDGGAPLGSLSGNTVRGVFGSGPKAWQGQALPVASGEQVHTGAASIRSTLDSRGPRDYSVEILKIYPSDRSDGRNLLLRVTDPDLLTATGGIVQGMGVSYNRDNTGTLRSLQGLGDSPGFSLTKKNLCTRAGTQGRTSFVSSDQAIRMKYIERRFYNLSTLIKQPNIILPHRIRHRAVSVTLFGAFCFDWRKL